MRKRFNVVSLSVTAALLVTLGGRHGISLVANQAKGQADEIPTFQYDPTWPKQLPNNWITGNIGALYMEEAKQHIWVAQRPSSTTGLAERYGLTEESICCFPAPPIMEFDTAGNLIQAWGPIHGDNGELLGRQVSGPYPEGAWPSSEHGLVVDHKGNVWVDSQSPPSQLIKLTHDGKFLLRIGKAEAKTNSDTMNLAGPTGIVVDAKTNEVFVADGYRNRRLIVFDADTGAYKRHWGAYGKRPADDQGIAFQTITKDKLSFDPKVRTQQLDHVHCLSQGKDGLLYVCDRANNRIQVFKTDGTFVTEGFVAPRTRAFGSTLAIGFSPDADQRFLYVADGPNHKVWILRRSDLTTVGDFGTGGRNGGQFGVAHALAVDAQGNIYVGETIDNNRVQKFTFIGMRPSTAKN